MLNEFETKNNNVYNFEEYIKQSEESCRENEMIFNKSYCED
jgi:hypothetical protein